MGGKGKDRVRGGGGNRGRKARQGTSSSDGSGASGQLGATLGHTARTWQMYPGQELPSQARAGATWGQSDLQLLIPHPFPASCSLQAEGRMDALLQGDLSREGPYDLYLRTPATVMGREQMGQGTLCSRHA